MWPLKPFGAAREGIFNQTLHQVELLQCIQPIFFSLEMTSNKQNSKNVKSCSEENVDSAFNEDRKQLYEINDLIKTLVQEVKTLKEDLKVSNLKVKNLKIENVRVKKATNLTLFKLDALEQNGWRENLRVYGVPETNNNNDDGEDYELQNFFKFIYKVWTFSVLID